MERKKNYSILFNTKTKNYSRMQQGPHRSGYIRLSEKVKTESGREFDNEFHKFLNIFFTLFHSVISFLFSREEKKFGQAFM